MTAPDIVTAAFGDGRSLTVPPRRGLQSHGELSCTTFLIQWIASSPSNESEG